MKALQHIILPVFIIGLMACDKNHQEATENLDVETYIDLLKSNQYDSLNLPEFTYNDIPELLQYRNENQLITDFPHNPISSLWESECKLGIYVLWTIESIRAVSINSEYLIMRFPSQNPVLKDSDGLELVSDSISHKIAADAYYDWWENNKDKDFDDFKNIDPLENTGYGWH
ncbi:MAG: DUF4943 family protein [Bacteroidales bacterium]|jgi:hypothetical protein|nr:DUF4943 family protein [Bacteroidales bacterium]